MFVTDALGDLLTALQFGVSALQFQMFTQLILGGWVTILRSIGFFIDKTLISIITKGFEYFELIISKELFTPSLINSLTKNVYFFIAVFVLFKLVIRFMKYIIEPDLISDQNIGTNAIIKRTIVGMCLILFIPSIFGIIRDFQKAIIADDIINKMIMDTNTQIKYEEVKKRAPVGQIIGYSVLRGFLNHDEDKFAASLVKKQWQKAENNFDASLISINAGSVGAIDNYHYDYIPIISTVALGYTAWLIIKYCFDLLVRFFKLAILQIISPIVMVDYIFDGGDQGTFKQWTTTVISTFAMLFIRILSLSLVIMVCIHMQMSKQDCLSKYVDSTAGTEVQELDRIACENSLLYVDKDGDVDNLLRAAVIIALLAFSMDLPKLFSQIFGLDLEQESSVTGMVQKVGGIGKMVGLGGLAIGGGLLGGAVGNFKAAAGGAKQTRELDKKSKALDTKANALKGQLASGEITKGKYNKQMKSIDSQRQAINKQKQAVRQKAAKQSFASTAATFGAIAAATPLGRATSAYSQGTSAQKAEKNKQEEQEKQAVQEADTKAYREHLMSTADKQLKATKIVGYKLGVDEVLDIQMEDNPNFASQAKSLKDSGFKGISGKLDDLNATSRVTATHVVNVDNKVDTIVNTTNDISRNVQTAVNTTQVIAQNTDTIVNNTNNISQNTDTIINQTEHISNQVDKIEDNTFYSGVDSINNMENSGYIDKPVKNLSDNASKSAEPDKKNNNDDIQMLNG